MNDIAPDADVRMLEQTLFEVKKVIVGQDRLVERLLTARIGRIGDAVDVGRWA